MNAEHRGGTVTAVLLVVCGLFLLGSVATGGGLAETETLSADEPGVVAQTGDVPVDRTTIDVELQPDGSAAWEVSYYTHLETEEDELAFDGLADDIEADPTPFRERFAERMSSTADDAEAATTREMAITDVTVSTRTEQLPEEYGIVVYSFTWDGFAAVDEGTITAGDAIDGFLLVEDTRLSMYWPADYRLDTVDPDPDSTADQSVTWHGADTDFVRGQPRVTLLADDPGPPIDRGAVAIGLLVLLLVILGWLLYTERITVPTGGDGAAADTADRDLQSNEEQVLAVIRDAGGRVKQQEVVSELGWTEAKTSQVVSKLESAEKIDKFRIGRENVLALPDDDT